MMDIKKRLEKANFKVHPINLGVLVHQVIKSIINKLFFFVEKLLFYIIDNYNN